LKTTLFVKHPYLPVCFRFIALSWLQILLYSETRTWHRRQIFKAQVEISIHIMQNKKGQGMYFVIFVRKISSEGKTIWACKTFLKCPFKMVFLATWIDILKPLPLPNLLQERKTLWTISNERRSKGQGGAGNEP
jgi:hypothetical protein